MFCFGSTTSTCLVLLLVTAASTTNAFAPLTTTTKMPYSTRYSPSASTLVVTTTPTTSSSTSNTRTIVRATQQDDLDMKTEEELLASSSNFTIPPSDLISMAKDVMMNRGIGLKDNGTCLAENFVFRAAFVETSRNDFVKSLQSFNLEESFDIHQQYFGWTVDPLQPNRVWFFNRQSATHSGSQPFIGVKATGKELVLPPQCYHLDFDYDSNKNNPRVSEFGFYVVDRAQGNTGGLGGAFAFFYGVGRPLPFPEGKPYRPSLRRRMFTFLQRFLSKFTSS